MRRLEPAPAPAPTHSLWGVREKLIFVGAIILLAAVGLGVYAVAIRPAPLPPTTREALRGQVDRLTVLETMHLWGFLTSGLRIARSPAEFRYDEALEKHHLWLGMTAAAALMGLGLCGGALFVERPRLRGSDAYSRNT